MRFFNSSSFEGFKASNFALNFLSEIIMISLSHPVQKLTRFLSYDNRQFVVNIISFTRRQQLPIATAEVGEMADWRKVSETNGDVVFFEYSDEKIAKEASLVFVWDVDKTYLDTNIASLRGLLKTIREKAFQKKNIPGTATLVRALKESMAQKGERLPLYFITASPPQMENKIIAKLSIDGISPYGSFYKDNLKNLNINRFRRLTQQIGFKLQALLQLRLKLSENVKQIMWGDDSESDALIYSLYSDICADRIQGDELTRVLESLNVLPPQIKAILNLKDDIPKNDPVERIYINLATDTDPDYYVKFGARTLPTYNTFQIALDLYQDEKVKEPALLSIAQVLISSYSFSKEEIFGTVEDLIQRHVLKKDKVERIVNLLKEHGIFLPHFHFTQKTRKILEGKEVSPEWVPVKIDYLNDYR